MSARPWRKRRNFTPRRQRKAARAGFAVWQQREARYRGEPVWQWRDDPKSATIWHRKAEPGKDAFFVTMIYDWSIR